MRPDEWNGKKGFAGTAGGWKERFPRDGNEWLKGKGEYWACGHSGSLKSSAEHCDL
jgi:hypothetical protein